MKLTKHKKWFQSKTVDALDQHAVRITMLTVVTAPSGPVLYPRNPVCTLGPLRNASKSMVRTTETHQWTKLKHQWDILIGSSSPDITQVPKTSSQKPDFHKIMRTITKKGKQWWLLRLTVRVRDAGCPGLPRVLQRTRKETNRKMEITPKLGGDKDRKRKTGGHTVTIRDQCKD